MSFLRVCYRRQGGSEPVRRYLEELAARRPAAYVKLALDLQTLGAEGPRSNGITVRPLGDGLWELKRLFEGIQYRIFFCMGKGILWLLHAIEKKSAKTALSDLRLARRRMRGVPL